MKNEPDKYIRSIFVTILKYTAFKFVNDNITVINNQDKYKTSTINTLRLSECITYHIFLLFLCSTGKINHCNQSYINISTTVTISQLHRQHAYRTDEIF